MSPERYQQVKEIFLAVLDEPADRREGALGSRVGSDVELRAEVESLLHSHTRAEVSARKIEVMTAQTQPDPSSALGATLADSLPPASTPGRGSDPHRTRARFNPRPRFDPGKIIAGRYRISGLLGSGGMGEVYRADDLTLDQVVALKFLPPSFSKDPVWLERFYNEVRLSRQVTHPNVCRVFDIGQVEGEQFISMEFVDGEDLAALLRRIGRLPSDKAVEIARQLCAGLAAAHDRGVLHRDLKPANVMLDGEGDVRITDFGISAQVESHGDSLAGTPAYMAPEQFKGGDATIRSDLYSLGLVLYEIFTGKPAFAAGSVLEYAHLHRDTLATHPSTFVNDINPIVEQVILRCIEKDPAKRPASAVAVAAALPGGDPLAAALAAGETPSPEMVAAAGGNAALRPAVAFTFLATILIGVILSVILARHAYLIPRIAFTKPPAVLEDKARDVLTDAGYGQPLMAKASGFAPDSDYMTWVQTHDASASRFDKLAETRPGVAMFWYRESPHYMITRDDLGMITLDEPARNEPGMRTVVLDVQGRLRSLEIVPDPRAMFGPATTQQTTANFSDLFKSAGLDQEQFTPVEAKIIPPMFADQRFAWQGVYPENPSVSVRVEAATLRGKPVYFKLVEPWMEQTIVEGTPRWQDLFPGNRLFHVLLAVLLFLSGVLLAYRNIRAGRGDTAGAHRLAVGFLILGVVIWALTASHVPQPVEEERQLLRALGFILVPAAIVWMFYLAMEPYVRRIWPETVISWTRLLGGRISDSLVMSHVLVGMVIGVGLAVLSALGNIVPLWLKMPPQIPPLQFQLRFLGANNVFASLMLAVLKSLYFGLLFLLLLVLLQLIVRRRKLAGALFVLAGAAVMVPWTDSSWLAWIWAAISSALVLFVMVRYGVVSTVAGLVVANILHDVPLTTDLSIWYGNQTIVAVIVLLAVATSAMALSVRKTPAYLGMKRVGTNPP